MRERADVIVVGLPKPPRDFEAERAEARRRTLYSALVDVDDLVNECFDESDVAESLGADEMKRRLATYSMKTGGRLEERAARLWALVEAGGDLDLVRAGAFVGGEAGKRDARARARGQTRGATNTGRRTRAGEERVRRAGSASRRVRRTGACTTGPTGGDARRSRCTSSRVDSPRTSRMRFATRVSPKLARVVMVDESATSAEADLIASTARGGRGLNDRPRGAHLDDIAAGVLLDRYFAGSHGDAEEIPPANSSVC